MTIARYWNEEKADGRFLAGVPARDLTDDEFEALPPYLQRSIDASDIYRKTKPQAKKPEKEGDD